MINLGTDGKHAIVWPPYLYVKTHMVGYFWRCVGFFLLLLLLFFFFVFLYKTLVLENQELVNKENRFKCTLKKWESDHAGMWKRWPGKAVTAAMWGPPAGQPRALYGETPQHKRRKRLWQEDEGFHSKWCHGGKHFQFNDLQKAGHVSECGKLNYLKWIQTRKERWQFVNQ